MELELVKARLDKLRAERDTALGDAALWRKTAGIVDADSKRLRYVLRCARNYVESLGLEGPLTTKFLRQLESVGIFSPPSGEQSPDSAPSGSGETGEPGQPLVDR